MHKLLSKIDSPSDLRKLTAAELDELAAEIRQSLCSLVATRSAHFASNLGVVELCLALHTAFDFSHDRLIWDTGHQVYPHKLVTGRYDEFGTIRTKDGLMGYPNPAESPFDLFMTGHAGCSVSTALGLHSGDQLLGQEDRHAVAVIGDGAFIMTALEILTASTHELGAIFFVFHDGELAQISQFQSTPLNRKTCTVLADVHLEGIATATGAAFYPMHDDFKVCEVLDQALETARGGRPVIVDVNIDYSRKTAFTKGVVKVNLGRFPLREKVRFVGRALKRHVLG